MKQYNRAALATVAASSMRRMRIRSFKTLLLIPFILFSGIPALAQSGMVRAIQENCAACLKAKADNNAPELRYKVETDFVKLPPNLSLGENAGIAQDSKGHVFVFTRSHGTQLFEFGPNGEFIREIGQGLYGFALAHSVRIDRQDNIWVVDTGTNMVIKFNPKGRVDMVIGRRPESHGIPATPPAGTPVPAAKP